MSDPKQGVSPAAAAPAHVLARPFLCGACGASYVAGSWSKLELAQRLAPDDVRGVVSGWPENVCVEVRTCRRCTGSIAAKCRWPIQ